VTLSTNSLAATDSIYTYAYTFKRKAEYIRKLKLRIFEFKPVPGDIRTLVPNYDWLKELVESEDPPEAQERDPISFFSENPHMCIHAKSFVVDGAIAWIGTSNLDPRSIHLNSELGLTVWDKDFAGKLKKDIERDIDSRNSWAVGLVEPTSFWTPLSNAIGSAVNLFPFVDLWPFSEISLYELKEGGEPVPFFHPDFYDNYKSVGPFPEVELTLKEIRLRFLKPIMIYAEPII
jgi:phosphatidylserine/phosphatidylglycerophosphate/cardiolipin synthase-like enzyme